LHFLSLNLRDAFGRTFRDDLHEFKQAEAFEEFPAHLSAHQIGRLRDWEGDGSDARTAGCRNVKYRLEHLY